MSHSPEELQSIINEVNNSRSSEMNAAVGEVEALSLSGAPQSSTSANPKPKPNPNTMAYHEQATKEVENFLEQARSELAEVFNEGDLADAA